MSTETQTSNTTEQNQTQTNTDQTSTHGSTKGAEEGLLERILRVVEKIIPLKVTLSLIDTITAAPLDPLEYMLAEIFQLIPVMIIVVTMINAFEKLVSIG